MANTNVNIIVQVFYTYLEQLYDLHIFAAVPEYLKRVSSWHLKKSKGYILHVARNTVILLRQLLVVDGHITPGFLTSANRILAVYLFYNLFITVNAQTLHPMGC